MALPITVPFTFGNATTTQSLSSLDADFSTVYNAVNGIGNGTVSLANVTITGGSIAANITASGIFSGTSNVSITSTNGPVSINTNGNNAVYVNTSGSVGIGTSSPGTKLDVSGSIRSTSGNIIVADGSGFAWGAASTYIGGTSASSLITFNTASTEHMRIDSSGNLLVGTTSTLNNARITSVSDTGKSQIVSRSNAATAGKYWNSPYVSSANQIYIINQDNLGVYITDGATAWAANSDERLKDIIAPITSALEGVQSLRAVKYNWKSDADKVVHIGLIAQDVQKVLPEVVASAKLPLSEDETEYLSVAYTEVIPLLVAAIKELSAKNDALETRLAALEDK